MGAKSIIPALSERRQAMRLIYRMNNRIDIYPSIWRVIVLIFVSALFVMGGFLMTIHPRTGIDIFIGYLGVVFFSFTAIIGIVWLILRAMRKPLARIYDDRLEYLIPVKMKYEIIPFLYVEMFVTVKVGAKLIRADYLTGGCKNTGIINTLVPVGKMCDMLNDRLEKFWSQPLNKASVTKYLSMTGIESWRFVHFCTRENCASLKKWNSLDDFLTSEIHRIYTLFDEKGVEIDESTPTIPI
ncbi:hypothetical protein D7V95_08390 [bacterium J10(2018)]|nr:hypothetical protein D7V95_08390 [bacterium J10(2018)]